MRVEMPRRRPGKRSRARHPSRSALEASLRGELPPEELRGVVSHLLGGCARCGRWLLRHAGGLAHARRPSPPRARRAYDGALDRGIRRAFEARGLPPPPTGRRRAALPEVAQDAAWVERCMEESHRQRHRDPEMMLMLARAAALFADRLDAADYLPGAVADLQARAWAERANAHRAVDALDEAEVCFGNAVLCLLQGSQSSLVAARVLDLLASLRVDQRRFDDAFRLLDVVHRIHLDAGDLHLAGRALVSKGFVSWAAHVPEEAISLLERGLAWIDAERDPELFLTAVHNLADAFATAERFADAAGVIAEHRGLYARLAEPLNLLKLRWVEAKIAAGLGDHEAAARGLVAVRAAVAERRLGYDAALAGLDLAVVWLEMGRSDRIPALAEEMLAVFRRLGIRREAIAALLVLREAAARERATRALIRRLAGRLETLQHRPARPAGREVAE
jgi:tetratricopeptide (TPR) repeat protein